MGGHWLGYIGQVEVEAGRLPSQHLAHVIIEGLRGNLRIKCYCGDCDLGLYIQKSMIHHFV